MKKFMAHSIAVGIVTVWAAFAYVWLKVEDGSSGLSIFGKISAVFFLPGGFLMQFFRGSLSNSEIPLAAIISWFIFALIALAITQITSMILHRPKTK